jgi:hypothetical protein
MKRKIKIKQFAETKHERWKKQKQEKNCVSSREKHTHLSAKTCCVRGTTSVISSAPFFDLRVGNRTVL